MASLTTFSLPSFLTRVLSGFRQRRREVHWESSSSPETCPHLVESIPCEDPACYLWQVQQEGSCIPNKHPCGPGTAVQNVTCVSSEGTVLNLHHRGTVHIKIKVPLTYQSLSTEWVFVGHSEWPSSSWSPLEGIFLGKYACNITCWELHENINTTLCHFYSFKVNKTYSGL